MIRVAQIGCVPSVSLAQDIPIFLEALERGFHRGTSDARAALKDLSLRERSQCIVHSIAHNLIRSAFTIHRAKPLLKIPITAQDDAKEILDEGSVIVLPLMPSAGDLPQYIVVCILRTLDLLFDAEVLAHHEAALVQQQCGKKSAHPSIAAIERMDAQEIADEYGDQDQRIHHLPIKGIPITCADRIDSPRCLERFERSESGGEGVTIGMGLVEVILGVLELPPKCQIGRASCRERV